MDDAAQVQLFGGKYRKAFREVKAHLVTETTHCAGAGAVTFVGAVVAHVAHQFVVLLHGWDLTYKNTPEASLWKGVWTGC